MNIDTKVSFNKRTVAVGAIIGDSQGQVFAALAKCIPGPMDPKLAEIKVLGFSLQRACNVGLPLHNMESDALAIVQSPINWSPDNSVGLAKYALGLDDELVWLEDVPPPESFVGMLDISH